MEPIEVFGVEHIDVTVNDLKKSAAFYNTVMPALGFRRLIEDDGDDIRWGNAHMTFAIRLAKESERGTVFNRYRVGLHHLAFKASSRESIDEFYRFSIEENLPVLDAPREYPQYGPNYYAVFFADPDGMKLELVHFPWGFWRIAQRDGADPRPRHAVKK
ncbi:MAG TPA: VOC family protein [Candidatus Binataceae bacterium]|nr:VOC family protein [Candidatus Binataceae bacterium]